MDYRTTLHEALKRRLIEVEGPLEFGNDESRTRRLYYLKRLEDNLAAPWEKAEGPNGFPAGGTTACRCKLAPRSVHSQFRIVLGALDQLFGPAARYPLEVFSSAMPSPIAIR